MHGAGLQWTSDNGQSWNNLDPDNMASRMDGFWMMFVTSTTVCYGDIAGAILVVLNGGRGFD
jgi:hypothetical protein